MDILYHLLLGRSRETRYRYGGLSFFLLLVFPDELADVQVIDPEILPPRGETMGFINHETDHMACQQNPFKGL